MYGEYRFTFKGLEASSPGYFPLTMRISRVVRLVPDGLVSTPASRKEETETQAVPAGSVRSPLTAPKIQGSSAKARTTRSRPAMISTSQSRRRSLEVAQPLPDIPSVEGSRAETSTLKVVLRPPFSTLDSVGSGFLQRSISDIMRGLLCT